MGKMNQGPQSSVLNFHQLSLLISLCTSKDGHTPDTALIYTLQMRSGRSPTGFYGFQICL